MPLVTQNGVKQKGGDIKMGEKLSGIAFVLIGVVFFLSATAVMYLLIQLGTTLEMMQGLMQTVPSAEMPSFTTYFAAGWVFAILQLITGFVSLTAGIANLIAQK